MEQEHGLGETLWKSLKPCFLWFTVLQYSPHSCGSLAITSSLYWMQWQTSNCQLSYCRDGSDGTNALVPDKLPCMLFITLRLQALFSLFYFNSWEELGFTYFCMQLKFMHKSWKISGHVSLRRSLSPTAPSFWRFACFAVEHTDINSQIWMFKSYKIISPGLFYFIFHSPTETNQICSLKYIQPFSFASREGVQHLF